MKEKQKGLNPRTSNRISTEELLVTESGFQRPQRSREQIKNLEKLINFVNTHRYCGSGKYKKSRETTPTNKELLLEFLEDHGSAELFSEPTKSDLAYYKELCLESPAKTFTDMNSWAQSEKYQSFIDHVMGYYTRALEQLVNDPENSKLQYWNAAQLWQKYSLAQQLSYANPTASLMGVGQFFEDQFDPGELAVELVVYSESKYGFHCINLLEDLCTGFYYAVTQIQQVQDSDIIRICRVGVKERRNPCNQFIIVGKEELRVLTGARQQKRGAKLQHCSSLCKQRSNQTPKPKGP